MTSARPHNQHKVRTVSVLITIQILSLVILFVFGKVSSYPGFGMVMNGWANLGILLYLGALLLGLFLSAINRSWKLFSVQFLQLIGIMISWVFLGLAHSADSARQTVDISKFQYLVGKTRQEAHQILTEKGIWHRGEGGTKDFRQQFYGDNLELRIKVAPGKRKEPDGLIFEVKSSK